MKKAPSKKAKKPVKKVATESPEEKLEEFTHGCIKCSTSYTDTDPDPYYCTKCNEERKKIAQEVDKKMARLPKTKKSPNWSDLEALKKERGVKARGITWLSEKDLLNL